MKENYISLERKTVTREHLSGVIKREIGLNGHSAAALVDQIIELMVQAIMQEREVQIRLFGSFHNCKKEARVGRNPKTMASAVIPERRVVRFKIAPSLKRRINENVNYIMAEED